MVILDEFGNCLVASLDGGEVTYKPPISEWVQMEGWDSKARTVLFCHLKPPSIFDNIKSVKTPTGAAGLMMPLVSPYLCLKIAEMKSNVIV